MVFGKPSSLGFPAFLPNEMRLRSVEEAKEEILRRTEEYPEAVHHVKVSGKTLLLRSDSVEDYLKILRESLNV
jgi:hypothetical protein